MDVAMIVLVLVTYQHPTPWVGPEWGRPGRWV